MTERLRWKLWGLLIRMPGVCPSNAHTAIVLTYPGRNRNVFTDQACRRDCAAIGFCWCGKLRHDAAPAITEAGDE
jgi:hypothetical protein